MSALPPAERERYRDLGEHVGNWLGFTDPPKHTRMRNLVAGTVTSDLAERLQPRIARIVAELLEALPGGEEADLLASFAYPLPATVICEILGIPEALSSQFRHWVEDIAAFVGGGPRPAGAGPARRPQPPGVERAVPRACQLAPGAPAGRSAHHAGRRAGSGQPQRDGAPRPVRVPVRRRPRDHRRSDRVGHRHPAQAIPTSSGGCARRMR